MKLLRRDTGILGSAVALLLLGLWLSQPAPRPVLGTAIPAFELEALANAQGRLPLSDADNASPTVLQFFASWCHNCRASLPKLEQSARIPSARWVLISVDEDRAAALRAARSWGLRSPVGLDTEGQVARFFGITVLPTTVIVGRDGRVADLFSGVISEAELGARLRRTLDP